MFTPPPSPLPPKEPSSSQPAKAVSPETSCDAALELKHKRTSRIRWSILAVPAVLVFITLTTRYISHPILFDSISGFPHEPHESVELTDWGLHKRHPTPQNHATPHAARADNDPSPSVTTVPTIPASPPLPTPFPQPFDTSLSKNFSTQGCLNFYTNMTLSLPFRQCRPFGLLTEYSSQFIEVGREQSACRPELTVLNAGTNQRVITEHNALGHLQYGSQRRHLFQEYELVRVLP